MLDPQGLQQDEHLGLYLLRSSETYMACLETQFKPLGINVRDFGVLHTIAQLDTPVAIELFGDVVVTQAAMANYLHLTPNTMVAVVTKLEQNAWVQRGRHVGDRRRYIFELTAVGKGVLREAVSRVRSTLDALKYDGEFSDSDWTNGMNFVRRLDGILGGKRD